MDWNNYVSRINILGDSKRERDLNNLNSTVLRKIKDNPSCKSVILNGENRLVVIESGTHPYYKKFRSLPGEFINAGDYIEYDNRIWIVYDSDINSESYTCGNLRECNYKLYWQLNDGTIVSRYAWIQNASAYNNGEIGNNSITLQSNQFMVNIPYDIDTATLANGIRIHMAKNNLVCTPYELTRVDDITYGYGDKGIINIIFTQSQYDKDKDKSVTLADGSDVWICNYAEQNFESDDDVTDMYMKIKQTVHSIKANGRTIEIFAQLFSNDGTPILNDIVYEWNVFSDVTEYINYSSENNKILISVSPDCDAYGDKIIVSCMSKYTGHTGEIELIIEEAF